MTKEKMMMDSVKTRSKEEQDESKRKGNPFKIGFSIFNKYIRGIKWTL